MKKEKLKKFERIMSDMKDIEVIPYEHTSGDLIKKLSKFFFNVD